MRGGIAAYTQTLLGYQSNLPLPVNHTASLLLTLKHAPCSLGAFHEPPCENLGNHLTYSPPLLLPLLLPSDLAPSPSTCYVPGSYKTGI